MVLQFCKSALFALVLGAGCWFALVLLHCLAAGGRRPTPRPKTCGLAARPGALFPLLPDPAQLAALIPALMLGNFIYYIVAAVLAMISYKFCPKISVKFCLVW